MDTRDIDHLGVCFSDCGVSDTQESREEYSQTFGHAKDWYGSLRPSDAKFVSHRILERSLRNTVSAKIKPAGFIPSVVWWFIGRAIMNYIIKKIMEVIMSKRASTQA